MCHRSFCSNHDCSSDLLQPRILVGDPLLYNRPSIISSIMLLANVMIEGGLEGSFGIKRPISSLQLRPNNFLKSAKKDTILPLLKSKNGAWVLWVFIIRISAKRGIVKSRKKNCHGNDVASSYWMKERNHLVVCMF